MVDVIPGLRGRIEDVHVHDVADQNGQVETLVDEASHRIGAKAGSVRQDAGAGLVREVSLDVVCRTGGGMESPAQDNTWSARTPSRS